MCVCVFACLYVYKLLTDKHRNVKSICYIFSNINKFIENVSVYFTCILIGCCVPINIIARIIKCLLSLSSYQSIDLQLPLSTSIYNRPSLSTSLSFSLYLPTFVSISSCQLTGLFPFLSIWLSV